MTETLRSLKAAQCARVLLSLCEHAAEVLQRGYCVGELRARDVVVEVSAVKVLVSRRPDRLRDRMRHRAAVRRHLRHGHDSGCQVFGVPLRTMQTLLEYWGGEDAALFLVDIVHEAMNQLSLGGWGGMTPTAVLRHEIGRRLTVEPPADSVRDQALLYQIPKLPSKSASSRRAFTWLRKRAASAPSTMR